MRSGSSTVVRVPRALLRVLAVSLALMGVHEWDASSAAPDQLADVGERVAADLRLVLEQTLASTERLALEDRVINFVSSASAQRLAAIRESIAESLDFEASITLYDTSGVAVATMVRNSDGIVKSSTNMASPIVAAGRATEILEVCGGGATRAVAIRIPAGQPSGAPAASLEASVTVAVRQGVRTIGALSIVRGLEQVELLMRRYNSESKNEYAIRLVSRSGNFVRGKEAGSGSPDWLTAEAQFLGGLNLGWFLFDANPLRLTHKGIETLILPIPLISRSTSPIIGVAAARPVSRSGSDAKSNSGWGFVPVGLVVAGLGLAVVFVLALSRGGFGPRKGGAAASSDVESAGQIMSIVSHDIRGAISGILGCTELMRHDPELLSSGARRTQTLDMIERSCGFMVRLTNDLLDLRAAQGGKLTLEHGRVDLEAAFDDLVRNCASRAEAKGLQLRFDRPAKPLKAVLGDAARIRQVLQNLVTNAIQYSNVGTVTVRLASRDARSTDIEFSVSDTGVGIAPADQKKVFEAFNRGARGVGSTRGGTGLGLAIMKALVEAMGGSVTLVSALGKGTQFTVRVPLAEWTETDISVPVIPSQPQGAAAELGSTDTQPLQGMTLAIVDDAPDALELTSRILRLQGARTVSFSSAEDLLAALDCGLAPQCIVMDIEMPGMGGLEAGRTLRSKGYAGALIALSGHADDATARACAASGFDISLPKPTKIVVLSGIISKFVAHPELRRTATSKTAES